MRLSFRVYQSKPVTDSRICYDCVRVTEEYRYDSFSAWLRCVPNTEFDVANDNIDIVFPARSHRVEIEVYNT